MSAIPRKILVVGTSCSGKTTLARDLGRTLSIPAIDLDELHWLPGWQMRPADEFKTLVQAEMGKAAGWVASGNYNNKLGTTLWDAADTIVWLDYPLALVIWRFVKRTVRRLVLQEPACNGNFESLGKVFSKDTLLLWILKCHGRWRREYPARLAEYGQNGKTVVTLRTPAAARRYISSL